MKLMSFMVLKQIQLPLIIDLEIVIRASVGSNKAPLANLNFVGNSKPIILLLPKVKLHSRFPQSEVHQIELKDQINLSHSDLIKKSKMQ